MKLFVFGENILSIVHLMRILIFLITGTKRGTLSTNPSFDLTLTQTYALGYLFVSLILKISTNLYFNEYISN
jgi:hypothetical protein